jgi:hypothetical protein
MIALDSSTLPRFGRALVAPSFLALLASIAACGGAAPQVGVASPPELREDEPTTVEEAQARITRARDVLASSSASREARATEAAKPGNLGHADSDATRPSAAPPGSPSKAPSADASEPSTSSQKAGRSLADDGRCASPCRALASMRRAVTALCRMTGDGDARCLDAKRTLLDSEGRVSPCSC